MPTKKIAFVLLFLCTIFWGIGGPLIKYSFQFVSPFEFLFWRFLFASIVAFPFLVWYLKKYPLTISDFPKLLILSLFGTFLNLSLVFYGLSKTTVVETAIIGSLQPMFVAVAGALFLKELLTRNKLFGIILAIAGTLIAVVNPIITNGLDNSNLSGNIFVLLGIFFWIFFVILSKKWESVRLRPFHITSISFFTGLIGFFLLSIFTVGIEQATTIPLKALPAILYMAIFGSLLAFTFYEYALTKIEASQVEIFSYISPLWSVIIAIIWLKEKFDPILIISAIFIVIGVFIAEHKDHLKKHLRGHHLS